jgi:hypothetical protein
MLLIFLLVRFGPVGNLYSGYKDFLNNRKQMFRKTTLSMYDNKNQLSLMIAAMQSPLGALKKMIGENLLFLSLYSNFIKNAKFCRNSQRSFAAPTRSMDFHIWFKIAI